jgi:TPR repeat protein
MRRLKLLLVILVTAAAVPAVAGPYEDGVATYNSGDYATALRVWRPLAEQGNAAAQANLGNMYTYGEGVARDQTVAISWSRKAAEQGYANAQLIFGTKCEKGEGVPQDYVQAHKWYNLAASGSDADEQQTVVAAKYSNAVAAKMTPAQIAEAHKLAREWKPTPAL